MKPRWDLGLPTDSTGNPKPERKRIRTVRPGERVYVILLGDAEGVWTHFIVHQNRSRPCTAGYCAHCAGGVPRQRAWYTSALIQDRDALGSRVWLRQVLLLTETARTMLGDKAKRGAGISLHRDAERPNSPLVAEVRVENIEFIPGTGQLLPEPEDVRAALGRMWDDQVGDPDQPKVLPGPWPRVQSG